MSVRQKYLRQISNYVDESFVIDEHAWRRVQDYNEFKLDDLLEMLKEGNFYDIKPNDSAKEEFRGYDSYKIFIRQSSNRIYIAVVYMIDHLKPLIQTVHKADRSTQETILS
ncbi:MAG: hypothetical protein SV186_03965 [Candidatus Nanohaloarchaea archaeon]|nr:hypothetical protein [Candidatus Nanohaloarchaea archaeon]